MEVSEIKKQLAKIGFHNDSLQVCKDVMVNPSFLLPTDNGMAKWTVVKTAILFYEGYFQIHFATEKNKKYNWLSTYANMRTAPSAIDIITYAINEIMRKYGKDIFD